MNITLTINGNKHELDSAPSETLLSAVRRLGYYGVKFGDEQGLSGADTVLLDGKPINAGSILAAQAEGHHIVTIEGLDEHPEQGWRKTDGLHLLQQAFVETGAIQCGYCTPAQLLAADALLARNPSPTEAEVREALSGVLCRCTGYVKPVQAVMLAAERIRGGEREQGRQGDITFQMGLLSRTDSEESPAYPLTHFPTLLTQSPTMVIAPSIPETSVVGKSEKKVDGVTTGCWSPRAGWRFLIWMPIRATRPIVAVNDSV